MSECRRPSHLISPLRVIWSLLLCVLFLLTSCDRKPKAGGGNLPNTQLPQVQANDDRTAARQDAEQSLEPSSSSKITAPPAPNRDAAALLQPSLESASAEDAIPPQGSELSPEQAHRLLTGMVLFNPSAIPSSNVAIAPETPLTVGQDLQVKWGSTWWAGTIVGLEEDGRVRVHYFGWAESWDEPKTREELQLDNKARVRALDSTYKRKNW